MDLDKYEEEEGLAGQCQSDVARSRTESKNREQEILFHRRSSYFHFAKEKE